MAAIPSSVTYPAFTPTAACKVEIKSTVTYPASLPACTRKEPTLLEKTTERIFRAQIAELNQSCTLLQPFQAIPREPSKRPQVSSGHSDHARFNAIESRLNAHQAHHDEHSHGGLGECAKDLLVGYTRHTIAHAAGALPGCVLEIAINTACQLPNEGNNPHAERNALIKAGVHFGMTEAAGLVLKRTLAYAAMVAAQVVKVAAQKAEPSTDKARANIDMRDCWNSIAIGTGEGPSFAGAGATTKATLKAAQVPGKTLDAIHHTASDLLIKATDALLP